ncbi:metal-dependent hydrolase [Paenibacillus alkalitolerans]|uniref:metal-dependent hydrolase n=1 Tax=Paenibacillus alkalitolerans TaxID=2799335 RepID=UPI0018F36518|nr:metal-dependent hydrolase [Paenibacillus alkalitolerans]
MDTVSHLLFGATLAGVATLDPAAASHPELFAAILAGTMIGSHAPDLDTVMRLKGMNAYLRTHRGVSHSLPALAIWPAIIAVPLAFAFGVPQFAWHVYGWTMAAVVFHVILDLLNGYGVQCLRPFSRRWLHLDILTIFEPALFVLHAAALLLWATRSAEPQLLFPAVYGATFIYIGMRAWRRNRWMRIIRKIYGSPGTCYIIPSLNWWHWAFIMECPNRYAAGMIKHGHIEETEQFEKGAEREHPLIEATRSTDGVRTFLYFAQRVHVKVTEASDGYLVQWSDVRFWYDRRLPFGVDVKLDRGLNVVSERLGWKKKAWEGPYV